MPGNGKRRDALRLENFKLNLLKDARTPTSDIFVAHSEVSPLPPRLCTITKLLLLRAPVHFHIEVPGYGGSMT